MKKYLALAALLIPALAQAEPVCEKNPIYCKIVTLKPNVDKTFAIKLSNSIYRYSRQFKTDPMYSVAIAMQESSFENKNRMGTVMDRPGHFVYGATDVGVFQLHVHTIANIRAEGGNLDVARLYTDVDYQTYWHTKILSSKIKTCTAQRAKLKVEEGNEWSCYHSFTPSKRKIYLEDVEVHLTKIEEK